MDRFRALSPADKVAFISGSMFFTLYLALGILFLAVKNLPFAMSPIIKTTFGIILVAYSCLRLVRIVSNLKKAGNKKLETDNETNVGK